MQSPEPFLIFTRKLNELGVRYMVSGSIAAIYYGEPRLTNDVDIVVFLRREDAPRIERAFPGEELYCPPGDVIRLELAREQRGHFNLIHHDTGFKADIYLGGRDELHVWGVAHAKVVTIGDDRVSLAPPEYVIVRKLQFFREGRSEKHLRDIRGILSGLGEEWSREVLDRLIRAHGLVREWREALEFAG
jgi:hypothetical protein